VIKCQQYELYAAERDVPQGMWFTKVKDAQAYLDTLREQWWWSKFFWKAPARTEIYWRSRGDSSVGSYDKENDARLLEMLPEHRSELFILHELSHVIASALNDSTAHDPFFARTYLTLVYLVLDSDAYLELQRGFERESVDYMQGVKA
jgi:putative metallohydrolase (TIGR04338 family)